MCRASCGVGVCRSAGNLALVPTDRRTVAALPADCVQPRSVGMEKSDPATASLGRQGGLLVFSGCDEIPCPWDCKGVALCAGSRFVASVAWSSKRKNNAGHKFGANLATVSWEPQQ